MITRSKISAKTIVQQARNQITQGKAKKKLNKSFVANKFDQRRSKTQPKNQDLGKELIEKAKYIESQKSQSECLTDDQIDMDFNVPCREDQQGQIQSFLMKTMIGKGNSNTLYVSGVPGVGKTTTVLKTLQKFKRQNHSIYYHYVNGMNIKKPQFIYDLLLKHLLQTERSIKGKIKKSSITSQIQITIKELKKNHYFVIDEVDHLMTKDQSIYYNLFDWAFNSKKFSIIAIGNTLDFPKRLDDKIASRMGHNNLIFKPYSQKQILEIIKQLVSKSDIYQKDAMLYASKKMATFTSDIRKIIQVLKRAQQQKKFSKIKIEDIVKLWEEFASFNEALSNLPKVYNQIIEIIKQKGGIANQVQIQQKLRAKQINFQANETLFALNEMQQMGLLTYTYKLINSQEIAVTTIKNY